MECSGKPLCSAAHATAGHCEDECLGGHELEVLELLQAAAVVVAVDEAARELKSEVWAQGEFSRSGEHR